MFPWTYNIFTGNRANDMQLVEEKICAFLTLGKDRTITQKNSFNWVYTQKKNPWNWFLASWFHEIFFKRELDYNVQLLWKNSVKSKFLLQIIKYCKLNSRKNETYSHMNEIPWKEVPNNLISRNLCKQLWR